MADHVQESLLAYVDGSLGAVERAEVDRHIATCEACRGELRSVERAHAALRSLWWPAAPPHTAERALLRATRNVTTRQWLADTPAAVRWGTFVGVAAVLVAVLLGRSADRAAPEANTVVEPQPAPVDSSTRFLLVLHAPSGSLPSDSQSVAARRAEYAAWGASMVRDTRFVSSAQLTRAPSRLVRESRVLLADSSVLWVASEQVQGFLIVRARDVAEAAEIARQSPHVRHGGTITVRQIIAARR